MDPDAVEAAIVAALESSPEGLEIQAYTELRSKCGIPSSVSKRVVGSAMSRLIAADVVIVHRPREASRHDTDRPITYWLSSQPVPATVLADSLAV